MAKGVKATPLAELLAQEFVKLHPNHPASRAWLAGEQREKGNIQSRTTEQNIAIKQVSKPKK